MLSAETADALDAMIDRLRADVRRLARERDELATEVRRLSKENAEQLDQIFALEQRLAMRDHREG